MRKPQEGEWCHIEIPSADPEKAKEFYAALFGWKFQSFPAMDYILYQTSEDGIGGGILKKQEQMGQQLINYVSVGEIEPYLEKIEAGGGKVYMPVTEVPNTGWFAIVADPDGNVFGLWKQNTAPGAY